MAINYILAGTVDTKYKIIRDSKEALTVANTGDVTAYKDLISTTGGLIVKTSVSADTTITAGTSIHAGTTISAHGAITAGLDPTNAMDLVTKQYLEAQISGAIATAISTAISAHVLAYH